MKGNLWGGGVGGGLGGRRSLFYPLKFITPYTINITKSLQIHLAFKKKKLTWLLAWTL
jgi:hypothetical protein